MDEKPTWNGHPVADIEHSHDLDARAAVHEFQNGMPREQAEKRAHGDYLVDQALHCAAHHLIGMKAAKDSGHDEAAAKHGEKYRAALEHAGYSHIGQVPPEVTERMRGKVLYKFKSHPSDDLFHQEPNEDDAAIDERIKTLLAAIHETKRKLTEKHM